jgi:predicted acyltransferase
MATHTTVAAPHGTEKQSGAGARLLSLDAFRGLTIAAMILVNSPGNPDAVYWPLEHAEWHGWTPADLIFPFFLFIAGVSMTFSFARRGNYDRTSLLLHIAYRGAVIFVLGLFLNAFPFFNPHTLRIPGVLQRIAICYVLGSLVLLTAPRRTRLFTLIALLLGYWALLRFVPVPGYGAGHLDPDGNLAAYIDRTVFGRHLWRRTWDPEGLLSTLPALATLLFGAFAGEWLRSAAHPPGKKALRLMGAGIAGIALGKVLDPLLPINKNLWTSSYAIFTAGFACLLLAIFYAVLDAHSSARSSDDSRRSSFAWAKPLVVFGVNPILVYAASSLVTKTLVYSRIVLAGRYISIYRYIFQTWFAPLGSPRGASLLFSIIYVLFWLAAMWALYRRNIFVKI